MLAAAILLGVLVIVQLIALVWITGAQAGHLERTHYQTLVVLEGQADSHARQIAELLQRIQAPETAVVQHQIQQNAEIPQPSALPYDDDAAFWESKESLAARL